MYTAHFKRELANDGLTTADLLTVRKGGAIGDPPERDIRTGDWKYRIEGWTTDRGRMAPVFTFREFYQGV